MQTTILALLFQIFFKKLDNFDLICQYFRELLDSGIFVRDFGTRLEEIDLTNSGIVVEFLCILFLNVVCLGIPFLHSKLKLNN